MLSVPGMASPSPMRNLRVWSLEIVASVASSFSEYRIVTSSPNSSHVHTILTTVSQT